MEQTKLLKWGKNGKWGDIREEYVANNYRKRGYTVERTGMDFDVNHKIDLIAWDPLNDNKLLYIQVKGFTKDWKEQSFESLVNKALKDNAVPIVARVNKSGRIYFWNPIKKRAI